MSIVDVYRGAGLSDGDIASLLMEQMLNGTLDPGVLNSDASKNEGGNIIPSAAPVTQKFGTYNPSDEVFSGGYALGTNIGVPEGTPLSLPPGPWKVVKSYDQAKGGYIGNNANDGYGNSVMVENLQTGEKLHYTHLSQVDVKPGDVLKGGAKVGDSGATGNVTGPHLNLEYYDANGKLGDVLQSSYGQYVPVAEGTYSGPTETPSAQPSQPGGVPQQDMNQQVIRGPLGNQNEAIIGGIH